MAEIDLFERSLADAFLRLADDVTGAVDAAAVARRVAREHPRRRPAVLRRRLTAVPRPAWVLLLVAALLALAVGSLVVGGRRPDHAVVIAPSPRPTPAATVITDETDVLATTTAKPLPAQATCPTGSDPDALGPADQARPSAHEAGGGAFDRRAGRIVLFADRYAGSETGSHTWTYDVCTNTWQRMNPAVEPPENISALVYDADSDRTVALTGIGWIWSYDLGADRWTRGQFLPASPPSPSCPRGVAPWYHDRSGLVVFYLGDVMWAYDADSDTLAKVRQRADPTRPYGSGVPAVTDCGTISVGYDPRNDLLVAHVVPEENGHPETWTFEPQTGTWRLEASAQTPTIDLVSWLWSVIGSRAVFDEVSGQVLFTSIWRGNRVEAYDAGQRAWRTLYPGDGWQPGDHVWCNGMLPVYDPLNARITCRGGPSSGELRDLDSGVSAFSTTAGQWRWLLEPLPTVNRPP
jgi:hypothetical protein